MRTNVSLDIKRLSKTLILACVLCSWPHFSHAQTSALWESLRSGDAIALLRHALAPGTGDPTEFKVDDCRTQRNLSGAGQRQAARIGDRFRENQIKRAQVFSSQWCRCLDTAKLLELGPVQILPMINSFFGRSQNRKPQTLALKAWLTDWFSATNFEDPVVLVTHQVNITALTDVYPNSGEMIIIRQSAEGDIEVMGTIKTK